MPELTIHGAEKNDDAEWELDVEFTPDFLDDAPQILMEDEDTMNLLRQMYPLLEKEKKAKKKAGPSITLPDREGVSGDGNKSGIPRSYGTAAGDEEWVVGEPPSDEVKRAQKKYKGNFDKEEMYALAGVKVLSESVAKVTKSDDKFYYVDVPDYGEVKIKKGNLLGVDKSGIPADVILKALKAAGETRSKEQAVRWEKFKKTLKPLSTKGPKSRSLQPKNESLGKEIQVKVKNPAVSGTLTIYPDGSGAPAVLQYKGVSVAFDFLGEVKANRIGKVSKESRKFREVAMKVLKSAYEELLKKHTDEDWRSKNAEMYK